MFNLLDDPFTDLATTRTVLVELRYAFYLARGNVRKTFPSLAFAARVNVDSRTELLRSLDDACLGRIRAATRHFPLLREGEGEGRYRFADYEVDRYLVWAGLDEAKLPLSTLSDRDVRAQLELMERRGCRDRVRVHMAVEVEVGGDEAGDEAVDEGGTSDDGSVESVGSAETMATVQTVKTIE